MRNLSYIALAAALTMSCHHAKQAVSAAPLAPAFQQSEVASPRAIVYRTRADYSRLVPVLLSADRKQVVSYPARTDVSTRSLPTPLADGWLLDNRGIGANVAFTTWTYEEYRALPATPSSNEILAHIVDADPLVEAWLCQPRATYSGHEEELLNALIENGFQGCTRLK